MAPHANTPTPGRTARVIQWLFLSRRQAAITIGVDIGIALVGLPLWVHLAVIAVVHLTVHIVYPGCIRCALVRPRVRRLTSTEGWVQKDVTPDP